MAPKPTRDRKRDKLMTFFHLPVRPRTPQPTESSSIDIAATQPPTTALPLPQSAGNIEPPVLNPHDTEPTSTKLEKVKFAKGKSFKRDMAILSIAYTLQESPELKRLIQLIVIIRDKDSEGQLTEILETCARFIVQLASATDAQRAEATRAITAFNETVAKLKTIQHGDGKSLDGLMVMINEDIDRIKPSFVSDGELGTSERLSKILDITIGTTITILTLVEEASSLIPVPWVQPLIGKVVSMLQAVSQTRSNYDEMNQVAATAGIFVVSCAVICSESTVGPSEKLKRALNEFIKTLGSIAGECDELSRRNLLSRYLQQSAHMGDLQAIRVRLNDAIQLFQTENSVNIKLDTEELNRKIDFVSLNSLPSHPDYTRNEYLEKSRDDVIRDISDWIADAPESVLWVHGAAGLGKSTVTQELVYLLKSEDRLAGAVFLTNLTTESPERVIQMISRQLGAMYPQAIINIADAARTLNGPHDRLKDYFTAYIFDPIRALKYPYQLVVVVDGLDEWRNYESFLAELVHIPSPSPLKFVLTSRFNYSIERAVDKMPTRKYPLPPASQTVIAHYFHQHFLLGDVDWKGRKPDDVKIHRLAARADGLLIWAATARLLVTNKFDTRYPHEILDQLLSSEEKVVNRKDGPEDGQLERLYRGAISTLFPPRIRGILRDFLAATVVLQEALPIGDFAHLLGIPGPATEEIHQRLAALQTQGDPKTNVISPASQRFHASFVEFITTDNVDQTFQAISTIEANSMLAKRCIKIVFGDLLPSSRGKTCTYTELRGVEPYVVKFWPLHFSSGTPHQQLAALSGTVGMDLISEEAMHRWATLFLPCIAARFQGGHDSLEGIQNSVLPYKVAVMIGNQDVTTLSYHIQCLKIATQTQPHDKGTWKALGFAYRRLHEQSQSNRDLDKEITAFRHGLEPAPHPDRSQSLNNLAYSLNTRFERWGASNDLDEAISLHQEALLLRPAPHPNRSASLNNLANALQSRFEQQGASNDLDEAISLHQEALLLLPAPHPDHSMSLNNLANALQSRFEQQGASNDLDEAISLHREALLLRPAPHPDRSSSLNNLANALQSRFEQGGASNDLDEAISLYREALLLRPAPHPERSSSLNNLANALQSRFEQWGASNDLDEAISLHREALLLRPAPHPDHSASLYNLADAFRSRFEQRGASNDLDETISLHREALLLRPAPHPDRSSSLNNLANALQSRFEQGGASNDLDEAISLHREALLLRPAPHPERSSSLNNLANALQSRFEQWGASNDLDEAISLHREALLLRPAPHPDHSASLYNLADAFRSRFEQRGASNDLDETISLHREALLLRPAPHPDRSSSLNNLAVALRSRFEQQGASNDLDEAISLYRDALLLRPAPHPRRSRSLNNLADALETRFEQQGTSNDLDEAKSLRREARLL
ncbi:tetratricopeptide repeat-containing protein [Laccaria bicolor S238N-H82]|uniref:Tetratricopeptide repeat-containing protein n=1 Tax=Laccaria bicolor (strain S238N-H82 / ATCC MYA-4686) TaxID=486041 RepID=B0E306_LACBS|nr:tetratricopeptide repeat-containing protein [Laccaria bicolor S238N-H82]EDQ98767.1 tetratricopeptide repeat-containing protein [Laccaria bicolor S238N-H82]|eukprot:XP_001890573.1 tetratricopeptide repeat-containing protein [Laccaria bicolor S238N-H82]